MRVAEIKLCSFSSVWQKFYRAVLLSLQTHTAGTSGEVIRQNGT